MSRWVAAAVLVLGLLEVQITNAMNKEEALEFLDDLARVMVEEKRHYSASHSLDIVGKPAAQSSSHGSGLFPASNAVDGHSSSDMKYCSHTVANTDHPWWRVDLEDVHCISKVRILNRGDCCSERLEGAVVRVGESVDFADNPTCGSPVTAAQAQPSGGTIEFDCSSLLLGRYVSVDIPGTATLQLCEVTVEECSDESHPLDIVGKPAAQSSSHGSGLFPASNAVDGHSSSDMKYCSHTVANTDHPWWRVDLEDVHCISKVRILNRGDCCSERLEGAVVRVGESVDFADNPTCGSPVTAAQAQPSGGTIEFDCSSLLLGRYVSVDIPGTATLQLCEVTVEEIAQGLCCKASHLLNIVGNPTAQSSSHGSGLFPASNAVDGHSSSDMAYCSHTVASTDNPWWRVDLEATKYVTKVVILNRGDCCSSRLAGAEVRAGKSSTVADNPTCGHPVTADQADPLGGTIEIPCGVPMLARYVGVDIPGTATLQLCEVNVWVLSPECF